MCILTGPIIFNFLGYNIPLFYESLQDALNCRRSVALLITTAIICIRIRTRPDDGRQEGIACAWTGRRLVLKDVLTGCH